MHHGVNGILVMARISDVKNQVDSRLNCVCTV